VPTSNASATAAVKKGIDQKRERERERERERGWKRTRDRPTGRDFGFENRPGLSFYL